MSAAPEPLDDDLLDDEPPIDLGALDDEAPPEEPPPDEEPPAEESSAEPDLLEEVEDEVPLALKEEPPALPPAAPEPARESAAPDPAPEPLLGRDAMLYILKAHGVRFPISRDGLMRAFAGVQVQFWRDFPAVPLDELVGLSCAGSFNSAEDVLAIAATHLTNQPRNVIFSTQRR